MTEDQEDLKEFEQNYTQFNSIKLCEIVVSSRYLGLMKEQAILCMNELAARRAAGDNFNFEQYIDSEFAKLPSFKVDLKKLINISPWDIKSIIGKI